MINSRSLILLAIALGLALAAVFVAQWWIGSQKQAALPPPIETIPIVVATTQISPLGNIKLEQLKVMEIPKTSVPYDASLPGGGLNFFSKPEEVVGKFATQTIYPNEVIVRQRLRNNQGGSSLSNILAPNMRAVTVRVNDVTGVAGFLLSGNHVDILNTRKAPDSDAIITQPVLQNVKILAVDQQASTDDQGKPLVVHTVTVEVRPQDASKLTREAQIGTIQMVLRNPSDDLLVPESIYASREALPPAKPLETAAAMPPAQPVIAQTPTTQTSPKIHGKIRTLMRGGRSEAFECSKTGCIPANPQIQQEVMENHGFGRLGKVLKSSVEKQADEVEEGDSQ